MGGFVFTALAGLLCLAYELAATLGSLLGMAKRPLLDALGRDAVRRFKRLAPAFLRLRLRYGPPAAPLPRRFLVLANHQSILDIPALMDYFGPGAPLRFVAKRELGRGIPFISRFLRGQGHALVPRHGARTESMRGLGRFSTRCLREGTVPVLFPEGTRSRDGRLGPFHSAALRQIEEATPLPVAVVALDGGWRLSGLRDMLSARGPLVCRVELVALLEPPHGRDEALACLERARELIAARLDGWRE